MKKKKKLKLYILCKTIPRGEYNICPQPYIPSKPIANSHTYVKIDNRIPYTWHVVNSKYTPTVLSHFLCETFGIALHWWEHFFPFESPHFHTSDIFGDIYKPGGCISASKSRITFSSRSGHWELRHWKDKMIAKIALRYGYPSCRNGHWKNPWQGLGMDSGNQIDRDQACQSRICEKRWKVSIVRCKVINEPHHAVFCYGWQWMLSAGRWRQGMLGYMYR